MQRLVSIKVVRAFLLGLVLAGCGSSDQGEHWGTRQNAIDIGQALVIRQAYGRLPGTAAYSRSFAEIYNRGSAPASLGGLTLQASAGGTPDLFALVVPLPGFSLAPGQSFLVAGPPLDSAPDLPIVPDLLFTATGTLTVTKWSKVALVRSATALPCGGTTTCSAADLAKIVDLAALGTGAAPFEGTGPGPALSQTTSNQRKLNGSQDTNDNAADFVAGAPQPRNMDSNHVAVPGAPALDASAATPFGSLTNFVYGPGGGQTGVAANAINPDHAGWIVGYVKDGNGNPLQGVTVTVSGQSKYGQSTTRAPDGRFDLIVNGGANYTLHFSKTGYFAVDRFAYVGWQQTAAVDDVLLVAPDANATVVSASSAAFQVAAGSLIRADTADTKDRTALLMIPAATKFKIGSTDLSSLTMRLTEYTAGADGLKRMPAPLTGSPAYTYAVEISADETAGQSVDFKDAAGNPKEVFFYVNDFISTGAAGSVFPVGSAVPSGYYDRAKQAWIASKSGTVIQVSFDVAGAISVDFNGGGVDTPAQLAAFGITSDELTALTTRYRVAGQATTTNLWRVPITHMTPYDCNYPVAPPPCEGALCAGPTGTIGSPPGGRCTGCCGATGGGAGPGSAGGESIKPGSIIGCDSQTVGETFQVAGTPYSLNYNSLRTPGYAGKRELKVDLTGPTVHSQEKSITVDVAIAGQTHHREFLNPTPNLSWTFAWDGFDGAGRPFVGTATATVTIRTYFISKYFLVSVFGELPSPGGTSVASQRSYVSYERTLQAALAGQFPSGGWSLGDWTLDQHHFLDVPSTTLYLGSGMSKSSVLGLPTIERVMGDESSGGMAQDGESATKGGTGLSYAINAGIAVAPNGDVFVADRNRIRRIDGAGKIWTVVGTGNSSCNGPNVPNFANSATDATLSNIAGPRALAIGADGSLYIAATGEATVRKATPTGVLDAQGHEKYSISTFAGGTARCPDANGPVPITTDNIPATSATFAFNGLIGISVASDGSVYVADSTNSRVRRIDQAGLISTIAGNGAVGENRANEGKLANTAPVKVNDVAAGRDGTVYIGGAYSLVSVDRNGILHYLTKAWSSSGSGNIAPIEGAAIGTQFVDLEPSVAARPDGSLVFFDFDWQRQHPGHVARAWVRQMEPSGIVNSLAASADINPVPVPNTPGLALGNGPGGVAALAIGPNFDVFAVASIGNSVYRIKSSSPMDLTKCADATVRYLVPNGDSGYCFDVNGRHKKTIDLHTNGVLYRFTYDGTGNLASVTDPGGRITTVTKTAGGFEIAAPAPGNLNQKTTITLTNGHASQISDSIGSMKPVAYPNGLLASLTDGENNVFTFGYDNDGFLTSDTSALGAQQLSRSAIPGGRRVTHTTPEGRVTLFDTTTDAANTLKHTTTLPNLSQETKSSTSDGIETTVAPDGTTKTTTLSFLARFGGQVPVAGRETIALPSGLTKTTLRSVTDPVGGPEVTTISHDNSATPPKTTTSRSYDATGQTAVTTSPEGRTRTVKTDATGHVISGQLGSLTPTTFNYVAGQLTNVAQGARTTQYAYVSDSNSVDAGYVYGVTDAVGSVTYQRHDLRGRLDNSTAAQGTPVAATTYVAWTKNNVLAGVVTPEVKSHYLYYDGVNQLSQYWPPPIPGQNIPTNFTYFADRNLSTEGLQGAPAMTRTYIPSTGQLDTITLPAASLPNLAGVLDYNYFPNNSAATGAAWGRVSSIVGPVSTNSLSYKYDGPLRTAITWAGDTVGSVAWGYDNRFFRISETVTPTLTPGGIRYMGYDKDGLLTCNSATNCNPPAADALLVTHSPTHGFVTRVAAGNTSEMWTYSDTSADITAATAYGELRRQLAGLFGTTFASIVYDAPGSGVSERRDALGRIRFKTETFRNATTHVNETTKWEYQYDERGQLKAYFQNGTQLFSGTYDKDGNPTQYTSFGVTTSCSSDDQDRLLNCGGLGLTYYPNGGVKTKLNGAGLWTYHYDALGRLRAVQKPGNILIEYVLDGEGRRIAKKIGGVVQQRWLYKDGLNPIAELDGAGALVARFVYGSRTNVPDLVIRGGNTYRLISDQIGSPRYAVNVANIDDVPYQVTWYPVGAPVVVGGGLPASSLSWIPFGFAGGLYDPDTGLVHFGARDYDPSIGRWVSKDPILFRGRQANLYVYAGNDPVNRRDPTGRTDAEAGNLLQCTVQIAACAYTVCDNPVTAGRCGACLLSTVTGTGSTPGPCGRPFGFPDFPDFPDLDTAPRPYPATDECQGPLPSDSPDCKNENMCGPEPQPEPNQSIGSP